MKAGLIHPHGASVFHQLVGVVKSTVRRQGNVTFHTQHDLYLHAALSRILQCFLDFMIQREIRVDDHDAVLRIVDGMGIKLTDDLIGCVWLTIDDADHLVAGCGARVGFQTMEIAHIPQTAIVLRTMYVLARHLIPCTQEDLLKRIHLSAFDPAMHIVPRADLFRAFDVIIRDVHAACVCDLTVNDDNLSMVTCPHVIDPREADRIELVDLDTFPTELLDMFAMQRTIVAVIAKAIEHGSDLYTLRCFLGKQVEKATGDGVISKVEIFQVDRRTGLTDGSKQIIELFLPRHQQRHAVIMGKSNAVGTQLTDQHRITTLRVGCCLMGMGITWCNACQEEACQYLEEQFSQNDGITNTIEYTVTLSVLCTADLQCNRT